MLQPPGEPGSVLLDGLQDADPGGHRRVETDPHTLGRSFPGQGESEVLGLAGHTGGCRSGAGDLGIMRPRSA